MAAVYFQNAYAERFPDRVSAQASTPSRTSKNSKERKPPPRIPPRRSRNPPKRASEMELKLIVPMVRLR